MTKPVRFLLFDVDNTLYPRASGILPMMDARIEQYLRLRFPLNDQELKEMRRGYWSKYGTTLRGLIEEDQADPEDYLAFIHDVPVETLVAPNSALDDLLASIPARKVIFTNSTREHAQRVLRALGVAHHFDLFFDIRILDHMGKPDRRVYEYMMDALGAEASECLFIDDSPRNIRAARELGIRTIQVGDEEPCEGEYCIDELDELGDVLAKFEFAE